MHKIITVMIFVEKNRHSSQVYSGLKIKWTGETHPKFAKHHMKIL